MPHLARNRTTRPTTGHTLTTATGLGLVVTLQRRRIFVNLGRITEVSIDGAHLRGGTVDLDRFTQQTGEILASELYGRHTEAGTVIDVAIVPCQQQRAGWEVSAFAIAHGRGLLPRATTIVPWDRYPELVNAGPLAGQLASLREMRPADLASAVEAMPPSRRSQIAAVLDDEELADLLEEMPEQDQIRLLAGLGLERSADVVEEMQPRDRANIERDREVAARTQADTEFLARELAALRVAVADVVTTQDLEDSLSRLAKLMADQPSPDRSGFRRLPNRRLPRRRVRALALAGRRGREGCLRGRAWLCLASCPRIRDDATPPGLPALAVGVGLDQY